MGSGEQLCQYQQYLTFSLNAEFGSAVDTNMMKLVLQSHHETSGEFV